MTEHFIRRSFPAGPGAPGVARRAVGEFLSAHGATARTLSDILLAVSEVVTNCVVHGYRGRPGGEVDLEAHRNGDHVLLRVADHGSGMAPRLDSPGLGLGLPLVGRVAQRVEVSVPEGGGTLVSMVFRLEDR